jgi:hypothetical protein
MELATIAKLVDGGGTLALAVVVVWLMMRREATRDKTQKSIAAALSVIVERTAILRALRIKLQRRGRGQRAYTVTIEPTAQVDDGDATPEEVPSDFTGRVDVDDEK